MEIDLLYTIADKLNELPGIETLVLAEEQPAGGHLLDGIIQIAKAHYQKKWHITVKSQLTPAMLPGLLNRLRDVEEPKMVIAEYITPGAKALLKEANIAYADAAGNTYLVDEQLYIYIENNKTVRKEIVTGNRAFTKAGLKVLFLLLQQPDYVNETYRFIAEKTGVGLDTINKVYKALQKEKYLIQVTDRTFKWNKREELLINWVEGYQKNLKPKLRMKTFKALDKHQNWKELHLPDETFWGGTNAGDLLTGYLIADRWTLYTGQDFMTLMKAFKWVPDPEGNISVVEKFWEDDWQEKWVPPIIAYADLTEEDNPRYMETAKMIYEKQLQDII
jgi:hypothetical protein